jgi:carbonic anhydrase
VSAVQIAPVKVEIRGVRTNATKVKYMNDGHGVVVTFTFPDEVPTIVGGPLANPYELHNVHFHWPSEHRLFSTSYPAEMHLVHFDKQKYGSFAEAVKFPDGLAVLGIFFYRGFSQKIYPVFSLICN